MPISFDIPIHHQTSQEFEVKPEHSAAHLGSGSVSVLSTPSMILFMEIVARNSLEDLLPDGYSSVGIEVNIKHRKAVKIGVTVKSVCEIIEIDRKKIVFTVKVTHNDEILGEGTHKRFIIDKKEFFNSL